MKQYINKEVEVLFEKTEIKGEYKGHTKNYIVVKTNGNQLENRIINVKIEKIEKLEMIGNII